MPSKYASSVVQWVNPNSDNQSYQRIPQKYFNEIKRLIDGSKYGIAGEKINGKIYHITAHNPQYMEKRGFKDKGVARVTEYRNLHKKFNRSQNTIGEKEQKGLISRIFC